MVNRKLLIIVSLIIFIFIIENKVKQQAVAPECFEKEDCIVPVQEGYCEVRYDCEVGKCFREQIKCPEICYGFNDEDNDNLIDCRDPDCFNSVYCPCEQASFNFCVEGKCYCPSGKSSLWIVEFDESWCDCV